MLVVWTETHSQQDGYCTLFLLNKHFCNKKHLTFSIVYTSNANKFKKLTQIHTMLNQLGMEFIEQIQSKL